MPLRPYLAEHGIDLCGVLPLNACTIKRPYLLERAGFSPESKNETYVCLEGPVFNYSTSKNLFD